MASSHTFFESLGILESDVELAKADLSVRIHRLAEQRRLTLQETAAILRTSEPELSALFQGRLATCSLDQLLRMLTWLGDDVEILIRPRLHRTKRGALRVLEAAPVEKPDDFEPVRRARKSSPKSPGDPSSTADHNVSRHLEGSVRGNARQLLNKNAVEKMTSLDITTIYRKMSAGTFPQPVKIGRRRVAWRTSDIEQWQQNLEVGTETLRWKTVKSRDRKPGGRDRVPRDRR
jgi:prophage regulatory protein